MNLPLVLRDAAQADFDEAFDYYEDRQPGLGVAFAERLQECLDRVAAQPQWHGLVFADVRQAMVKKFPFVVCYRLHSMRIEVIAVMHTSRDASHWHDRVE